MFSVGALLTVVYQFGPMARETAGTDGPWFITSRAVRDYAALARLGDPDLARAELAQLSARAHLVRLQRNGLELWRVKGFDGRRIRLLVGEPPVRFPGAKPALVQVLGEF